MNNENTTTETVKKPTVKEWFEGARMAAFSALEKLKGKEKSREMEKFLATDSAMMEEHSKSIAAAPKQAPATTEVKSANLAVNPDIVADIQQYRTKNPDLDKAISSKSQEDLENEYVFNVMKRQGYEPGVDANIKQDVQQFRQDNPNLEARVKSLPRDRMENTLVLNEMRKRGYDPKLVTMKRFFMRPENHSLFSELMKEVAHINNPSMAEKILWKEKAPRMVARKGLKIS